MDAIPLNSDRYPSILDYLLEGCQVIGFDWKYLYVNDAIVSQGRVSKKEDLLGKTIIEAYPGIENTKVFSVLKQCMEERVSERLENEFVFPGGERGWFQLSIHPVPEGIFILSQEITERKRSEEAIKKLNDELIKRNTELQKLDKARKEFISLASHQLRTPLSTIKWVIELLMEENLTKDQKERIIDLFHANERLINLVNDLLDVSRIESEEVHPDYKKINISDLIEDVVKLLKAAAETKNKKIKFSQEVNNGEIFIDAMLFREALKNLIVNAISYSSENSDVEVDIRKESENYIVSVYNNGGSYIPEEEKPKIFNKFHRGESAKKTNPEGSGLGLFIAKSAIESMGGKIWFESEKGKGVTFYISLPIKEE